MLAVLSQWYGFCLHVSYLADLCTPVSDIASRQHLCSASSNQLVVPRHCRTQFGRRAFSVVGLMAWNALPDSIRPVNLLFQTSSEDSSFLLLLAYQRIRGFAFMRYKNPRLIDWLIDCLCGSFSCKKKPRNDGCRRRKRRKRSCVSWESARKWRKRRVIVEKHCSHMTACCIKFWNNSFYLFNVTHIFR